MITVKVDGSIEKALKEWKRKFSTTKILKELRERTQFEKKSVKRKNDVLKAAHKEKLRRNSE